MALRFDPTSALLFLPAPDAAHMPPSSFHDIHPEVSDALLPFVYDPDPAEAYLANAASAGFTGAAAFLGPPAIKHEGTKISEQHFDKKRRTAPASFVPAIQQNWYSGGGSGNQQFPPLPNFPMSLPQQPPLAFARGADENKSGGGGGSGSHQAAQSAAARERRKRISQKTAELSRLIPGGHRLSTSDMLQEAARHIKFLQAQAGALALMRSLESSSENGKTPAMATTQEQKGKMPAMATQEEMHALLMSRRGQQRLAAENKCLVPRKLVDAMAEDKDVRSDPLLNRELGRFIASLDKQKQ